MAHVPTTASAAARSVQKPPALTMTFSNSTSSSSGSSGTDDDEPALSALDSSAALILVHEDDDGNHPFDFSDDEEDRDDDQDIVSPLFEARKSAVFPPMSPTLVFLYLLAPYLKLGALELPNSELPLKYGLPALLLAALASAFARQIWYMLARYLRKADLTDILLDTLAKGRGKERQRAVIRVVVRTGTGTISTLLSVTYLRHSLYTLEPLMSKNQHPGMTYILTMLVLGTVIAYLSYARSLASRRVVYATWLSVVAYTAWLGCTIYAHAHGLQESQTGWLGAGSAWQGLATSAFAFCSSSTLPLYTSLKGISQPISTSKSSRSRSFRIISLVSVIVAVLALLPSVLFAANLNHPASTIPPNFVNSTTLSLNTTNTTTTTNVAALNVTHVPVLSSIPSLAPPLPSEYGLPTIHLQTVRNLLASATLLLGIPPLIVTAPPLTPLFPALRSVKFNVSRVLTIFIALGLALLPPYPSTGAPQSPSDSYFSSVPVVFRALTAALILMVLTSTYFVPAAVHILTHTFKRPLAIVVPAPRTPLLQTPSGGRSSPRSPGDGLGPSVGADELLLRKERALQRKQFRRRIGWDIGVWLLLGLGAVGVFATGSGLIGIW
ncbi:hypothetical protein BDN70DRAFT_893963 [Pholiota conissans]|uniref:Uncharacterized protein n=1 Tax=Pholiota conissans TaxID=109636 RepID=A0A9P5Z4W3_9AGAR|nr:hypothetical protein BDN70DRAFT_893963 [Pholiota conissans]